MLLSELEKPVSCPSDSSEVLCLAQHYQVKTEAAIAGLRSLVRVDEQREGIIADMQQRIDIRGGIIEDLKKVDANSQQIDTLGQDTRRLFEEQHRDDKDTIGDLETELASCRSNQKWIFGGGVLAGFGIGYKVRGAGQFQNPFTFVTTSDQQLKASGLNFSGFQSTQEDRLRQALKNLKQ